MSISNVKTRFSAFSHRDLFVKVNCLLRGSRIFVCNKLFWYRKLFVKSSFSVWHLKQPFVCDSNRDKSSQSSESKGRKHVRVVDCGRHS